MHWNCSDIYLSKKRLCRFYYWDMCGIGYPFFKKKKKWRIGYQRFAKIMIDLSLANLFYSFSRRDCNARFSPNVSLYRLNLCI